MFILNKTYLETAQTTLAWSLPSVSRTCCLWFQVSLPPNMTLHPQQQVMQPFLVSSDRIFFYHPSTYSNSLEASCFLAKWLLLHKKQLLAFMWSVAVILIFLDVLKTFFPLLAFPGNVLYWTQLNSASSSLSCLICCFCSSIIPTYCVSTLTFLQRWCNIPICRHRWCWCWWRCRCCVGISVFHVFPPLLMNNVKSMW